MARSVGRWDSPSFASSWAAVCGQRETMIYFSGCSGKIRRICRIRRARLPDRRLCPTAASCCDARVSRHPHPLRCPECRLWSGDQRDRHASAGMGAIRRAAARELRRSSSWGARWNATCAGAVRQCSERRLRRPDVTGTTGVFTAAASPEHWPARGGRPGAVWGATLPVAALMSSGPAGCAPAGAKCPLVATGSLEN